MDIFVGSNQLKAAIVERINSNHYDYEIVGAVCGIDPRKIDHYLMNYTHHQTLVLSHDELLRLCDLLGIEVKLHIRLHKHNTQRKLLRKE